MVWGGWAIRGHQCNPTEPTFCGLHPATFGVKDLKFCAKQVVQKSAFSAALRSDNRYDIVELIPLLKIMILNEFREAVSDDVTIRAISYSLMYPFCF